MLLYLERSIEINVIGQELALHGRVFVNMVCCYLKQYINSLRERSVKIVAVAVAVAGAYRLLLHRCVYPATLCIHTQYSREATWKRLMADVCIYTCRYANCVCVCVCGSTATPHTHTHART